MRILLTLVLAACGTQEGAKDAGADAMNDAAGDALLDATADVVTPCKTGLPDAGTDAVACGSSSCAPSQVCCIGQTASCVAPSSCGNVELVWACDRSAHCGGGETCCYSVLFSDFTTCPGAVEATQPTCGTPNTTCTVVCQTDLDCDAGQTCYATFVNLGDAASRTMGLCR